MSIHVALNHVTHYRYDRLVALGPQVVRLRPAPHCRTRILSYSLKVTPAKHFINWQQDPEANYLARFVFPEKTDELRIEVDLVAEMAVLNPFDFFLEPYAETFPFDYQGAEKRDLAPYLVMFRGEPLFREYLRTIPRERKRTIDFLVELNASSPATSGTSSAWSPACRRRRTRCTKRSGSCRDSAWLLVQLLRHMGLAARFVSGYLIQLTADMKSLDGPSGPETDFTDLHAWCEVYLPGAGWIGLDPTSGLLAGEGHIPLACTPEPARAAPVTGAVDKAEVEFEHHMSVERIWEAPRVTKPYTEEQWVEIEKLGHADRRAAARGRRAPHHGRRAHVRVGGRSGRRRSGTPPRWVPTSAVSPSSSTTASSRSTRRRACRTSARASGIRASNCRAGRSTASGAATASRSGRTPSCSTTRSEDRGVNAGRRRAVPRGRRRATRACRPSTCSRRTKTPSTTCGASAGCRRTSIRSSRNSTMPLERARLARVFEQGLDSVVGHVLPVSRDASGDALADRAVVPAPRALLPDPGRFAARLPTAARFAALGDERRLPVRRASRIRWRAPRPLAKRRGDSPPAARNAKLRDAQEPPATRTSAQGSATAIVVAAPSAPALRRRPPTEITRTAMCAEPRNGVLYIFMPPTDKLEDYLELVAAVEATAESMDTPVVLEGYEPPKDPRLNRFSVTPDPGVIEVNIHPSGSWDELVDRTTHLYDAARQSRLTTEKFMIDGRHTGTGGGNHFVLGGATPADSPFLRRPDLLRSLLGLLAQPSVAVVSVLRPVRRSDLAGAARR